MKKRFVLLRGFLAVSLCMMLPSVALAADWDAYSSDDVYDAKITMIAMPSQHLHDGNIAMTDYLKGNAGQTYTINGNGYIISDLVLIDAGTTIVNADVEDSDDGYALETSGEVDATINGDITGSVYAEDDSALTVNGNITGIDAENDVDMDDPNDFSDPYPRTAVFATDYSVVLINGDVTGANGYGAYAFAQDAIGAARDSNVTVNGDVVGGNVIGKESVGQINNESAAGIGVGQQSYTATVTINGNVTGGSTNTKLGYGGAGVVLTKGETLDIKEINSLFLEPQPDQAGTVTIAGIVKGGVATGEDGVLGAAVGFYGYPEGFDYTSLEPSGFSTDDLAQLTVLKLEPAEEGAPLFGNYVFSRYDFTPEEIQAMADKTLYIGAPTATNGTVASNIDNALAGDTVTLTQS